MLISGISTYEFPCVMPTFEGGLVSVANLAEDIHNLDNYGRAWLRSQDGKDALEKILAGILEDEQEDVTVSTKFDDVTAGMALGATGRIVHKATAKIAAPLIDKTIEALPFLDREQATVVADLLALGALSMIAETIGGHVDGTKAEIANAAAVKLRIALGAKLGEVGVDVMALVGTEVWDLLRLVAEAGKETRMLESATAPVVPLTGVREVKA